METSARIDGLRNCAWSGELPHMRQERKYFVKMDTVNVS
jgi:hypothetical protein